MRTRNFIVATAGHVDHGKSSLVKALTNTDPDRLPEEKKRGITIELGFAHLQLPDPDDAESTFEVGLIDVPGHEDFVQNMVMGVGAADATLLVVAADDGWMPQTEEHLQILSYLGVKRGIVAVTKTDLPDADPELAEEMVREELVGTPFADAPVITTSVSENRGFESLKHELARLLARFPPRPPNKPRLWVDRAFTMRGSGTVVTGTLEGGSFESGKNVIIQPRNTQARIRGLQSFGQSVQAADPGTRTAVNLPDIEVSADKGKPYVSRGDAIVQRGQATDIIDVVLHKSARQISDHSPANKPLKHGARVRVHLGTSNTPARIQYADNAELSPGDSCLAQIRLESSVFACEGDRFTIRDWPETATLAGGLVLEVNAGRRAFRTDKQQKFLQMRADTAEQCGPWIQALLERDGFVFAAEVMNQSIFADAAITSALEGFAAKSIGDWLVSEDWCTRFSESVREIISDWHRKRPELPGYPLNDLRQRFAKGIPDGLFDAFLKSLAASGISVNGLFVHEATHEPKLQKELEQPCAEIRKKIAANPNEPPSRKMLVASPAHQRAVKYLLNTYELVELDAETVLGATVHAAMRQQIVDHIRAHGASTTSDLRKLIGTSRRIAMPLLELMDKEGITLRNGDKRLLRKI